MQYSNESAKGRIINLHNSYRSSLNKLDNRLLRKNEHN